MHTDCKDSFLISRLFRSYSGGDFETDIESINPRGSTIGDVNTLLLEIVPECFRESSSGDQSSFIERRPFLRANPLALSSRALIKQCFQKEEALCLYKGHLTIALNETEIGSILRVVADQMAKASYEMMENLEGCFSWIFQRYKRCP